MTRDETIDLLAIIRAVSPRFEVGDAVISVWHRVLEDQSFADMELGLYKHFRTNKFSPAPSELLAQARPNYPTALEAWGEVRNRIRRVGYIGKPEFSHPIINFTAHAIGWQVLCDMTEPDVMRSNFIKLYESQCHRGSEQIALGETPAELESGQLNELADGSVKDMEDHFKPNRRE